MEDDQARIYAWGVSKFLEVPEPYDEQTRRWKEFVEDESRWPEWTKEFTEEILEAQGKWLQYTSGPIERYQRPAVLSSDDRKLRGFRAGKSFWLDEVQRFYNETHQLDMKRFGADADYREEIKNYILSKVIVNGQ